MISEKNPNNSVQDVQDVFKIKSSILNGVKVNSGKGYKKSVQDVQDDFNLIREIKK